MIKTAITFCVCLSPLILSCENDKDPVDEQGGYSKGIYIINEGAYNTNTGSISFVNEAGTLIINDIFNAANGRPLGDVVQSLSVANDSVGIIVVNHSAKIEIVRLTTFQAIIEPVPVVYPRYFLQVAENKGYITSGNMEGKLYIMDLNSYQITDSINVGYGPEVIQKWGELAYVANSGGWVSDSTISVIDISSDQITDTIFVDKVPVDILMDGNNDLWVYCKGFTNYVDIETGSYLVKISLTGNQVLWKGRVGGANDYFVVPARFAVSPDGNVIYYLRPDGVYSLSATDPVVPDSPFISGNFYGLEVHPLNGRIYTFETLSFAGNGVMKTYNTDGTLFSQGMVGIGPNGAVFNLQ